MKYLKISNQVEIEPNAFHLIGACTKRGQNKIGYFGSGLKYAIAVLLRENIEFEVYAGLKKIDITHKPDKLRDQEFDVIYIDGQKTSMTTSMGPKWKLWQAIREIYCNARDEEKHKVEQVEEISQVAGETAFYIRFDNHLEIELFIKDWDKYFCFNRPTIIEHTLGNVLSRIGGHMTTYRKGIKASNIERKSLYDYDFQELSINESRLIDYEFYTYQHAATIWAESATEKMIQTLMKCYNHPTCVRDCFEHHLDFNLCAAYYFNQVWLDVLGNKILVPFNNAGAFSDALAEDNSVVLSHVLIMALKKCFGDEITAVFSDYNPHGEFMVLPQTEKETFLLKKCLSFFEEVNIEINYPIYVAAFENKTVLGRAIDGKIILSKKLFDLGGKKIVAAIMEEHMHLDSKCNDETRDFQNYIINQMITMLENKHGIFL